MPFVLEPDDSWRRPLKRRKLFSPAHMAHPTDPDDPPPKETHHEPQSPPENARPKEDTSVRPEIRTSDREELIQCIKRGERPTWVPKPNLGSLCAEADAQAEGARSSQVFSPKDHSSVLPRRDGHNQLRLSPPPRDPIERPPSALHTGDFHASFRGPIMFPTLDTQTQPPNSFEPDLRKSTPPTPPQWPLNESSTIYPSSFWSNPSISSVPAATRSRAPSLGSSLSSSFVMRAATSPLVHATSSPSFDALDDRSTMQTDREDKEFRRRTLPPHSFSNLGLTVDNLAASTPIPAFRRDNVGLSRAHRPRRSLTSFTYQPASTAQGVYPSRARRLSCASEISPRARSSMVGSFEESILRGRMSTPPSKPLDFVAQIGVLGRGDCSAKLKCPPHVSVPFPAVFYNYSSTNGLRTISDDSPSPYVGTIDLEHHLKPVEETARRRKKVESNDPDALMAELTGPENTVIGKALAQQENKVFSKVLLEGAYRVPQQGQLQVIIKNPNKTAVKLFLIPYSLEGMVAGTKTFVRQRSYSSGPIMENVISDKPIEDPLSGKHVLRYLIHLKFCCLSKGRFYLYDNVRVVFANRVPEGKEKLRNEIQLPEPKYSAFVPGSRSKASSTINSPAISHTSTPDRYELTDIESPTYDLQPSEAFLSDPLPFHLGRNLPPKASQECTVHPYQHRSSDTVQEQGNTLAEGEKTRMRPQSPEVYGFDRSSTSQRSSPVPWLPNMEPAGHRSSSPVLISGDGLLSKKLRELSKGDSLRGSR